MDEAMQPPHLSDRHPGDPEAEPADGQASEADTPDERIFGEALGLPAAERAGHVLRAARGDRALAGRVLDLLAAHVTAGSFLESPIVRPPSASTQRTEGPGTMLGPYELVKELGEGGFGVVYHARQLEPVRRDVALKIIKLGMDTREVIARFEAERQALAVLDHPHIARVFDAGATTTGRPYFVMELVEGVDITKYCDAHSLTTRERIQLFVGVCEALQHAHQRGLIHRDLKPSNILVARRDGKAVPKVIDFGIAKATKQRLTERTVYTELGQFIGTPVYMSPEQAEHGEADVDTRSDIYSLGVVLYELLAGAPPFEAKDLRDRGLAEIQHFIREHDPLSPSGRVTRQGPDGATTALSRGVTHTELVSELRGDLDWIVMKALEKERERRYESAAAFAQDLERFLAELPVLASPPSTIYRARKFVRRHRVAVGAGAMVLVALLGGIALMLLGFVEARRNARVAAARLAVMEDLLAATSSSREVRLGVEDADALLQEFVAAYSVDHPAEAYARRLVAERFEDEGRIVEAIAEYRRALDLAARLHGERSPEYTLLRAQIGLTQERNNLHDDARPDLLVALTLEDAAFVGRTARMNPTRWALARILAKAGDAAGALELDRIALDVVKEESPDDFAARLRAAQTYLTRGAELGHDKELGPVWLEVIACVDGLFGESDPKRGDVRLQLVSWNAAADVFPREEVIEFAREALRSYGDTRPEYALRRGPTRSALANFLFERNGPGDVEEALALSTLAIEDLRVSGASIAAKADAIEQYAERLEAHGRYGAAIRAHLEVVELRRAMLGPKAEVRRQKDALERLAQSLAYDTTLEQEHRDFVVGIEAVDWLERELGDAHYDLYPRLRDFLMLRLGNPLPVLNRFGGMMGEKPPREEKHPYSLAMAALAANLQSQRPRALRLLQEAVELAQKPEYSNDLKSQEMIMFVQRMLGATAAGD
jgi:serine/threonine protein kinase